MWLEEGRTDTLAYIIINIIMIINSAIINMTNNSVISGNIINIIIITIASIINNISITITSIKYY